MDEQAERKKKGKSYKAAAPKTIEHIFQEDLSERRELRHGVVVCGIRGGALAGFLLDNTIAAFKSAIELDLDMVELDVWMTKDQ